MRIAKQLPGISRTTITIAGNSGQSAVLVNGCSSNRQGSKTSSPKAANRSQVCIATGASCASELAGHLSGQATHRAAMTPVPPSRTLVDPEAGRSLFAAGSRSRAHRFGLLHRCSRSYRDSQAGRNSRARRAGRNSQSSRDGRDSRDSQISRNSRSGRDSRAGQISRDSRWTNLSVEAGNRGLQAHRRLLR